VKLYVDSDTGALIRGLSFPEARGTVAIKRGDSALLDFYFGTKYAAAAASLGAVTSFKFGAKIPGDYDGSYVVSNYSGGTFVFTPTTAGDDTFYRVAPGWNTNKLNNLLGNDPEGFQEVTELRAVADIAASLDGKFFILPDAAGSVGVWIDVDNSGTAAPAGATACTRAIEITTVATGDDAATVAAAIAAALDADAAFSASAAGSLVTITDAAIGARAAATAETSGFTVARWITGSLPNTMANVPYVDLDAEVEYIVGGNVTSTETFTIRASNDINRGAEGLPVNANPAYPDPKFLPLFRLDITGKTGGTATDLDSLVTIGIDLATYPSLYIVKTAAGGGVQGWQLTAGTTAEDAASGIVRPDDYAAATNEKIWKLVF
jgi:hypothetical protein